MRSVRQGGLKTALYIALVLGASVGLEAKGTTVKLSITGPGLAAPVEIVEPAILDGSNVFAGGFLGETVGAAPPVTLSMYTMRFDVEPPQNKPVRTAYAVLVACDARAGALWLYLPGRGEAGYAPSAFSLWLLSFPWAAKRGR